MPGRRALLLGALASVAVVTAATAALWPSSGDHVSDSLAADPVPTLTAAPGPTSAVPTASEPPLPSPPSDPTDGPHPVVVPGHHTIRLGFFDHDPTYRVVIWVGDERHGPFVPWQETSFVQQDTYAGLVFRFVFPERHECDVAARPLSGPLTGTWWVGVERIYLDHGCAGLSVWGDAVLNKPDHWVERTPTPTPSPAKPSPTPTPAATPSATATPSTSPS